MMYKFRSRTEARWAVFFNTLGIEYQYEKEGYHLSPWGDPYLPDFSYSPDLPYLPDFFLPDLGYWIEVKGKAPTEAEQRKASFFNYELALDDDPEISQQRLYIVYGNIPWPYPKAGQIVGYAVCEQVGRDPDEEDGWGGLWGLCWQQCPVCERFGIGRLNRVFCRECPRALVDELAGKISERGNWLGAEELARDLLNLAPLRSGHTSANLRRAYKAARSARFEWGAVPEAPRR